MRAIKSILEQTYSHFELILIDNNSNDDSLSIANEYANLDRRVKIIHEQKKGIVHALNTGLKHATGDYIARMDADDESMPHRFEKQVTFLNNNPETGVVAGQVENISYSENAQGLQRYVDWSNELITHEDISIKRFMESPLVHPTVMCRREIGEKFGLYREGNFPEDYELWLRWLEKGVRMSKLPEKVLIWHDFPERLTRTDKNYSDEAFFKIKSKYLVKWLDKNNPVHPEIYIWGASKISRKRVEILRQYNIRIKAYIDIKNTRQLDVPVIHFNEIPKPANVFILVYMKHENIRKEIQEFLNSKGYVEGTNYLLVS